MIGCFPRSLKWSDATPNIFKTLAQSQGTKPEKKRRYRRGAYFSPSSSPLSLARVLFSSRMLFLSVHAVGVFV